MERGWLPAASIRFATDWLPVLGRLAFLVDAAVLKAADRRVRYAPDRSRASFAISVAMVVGWLAHRRFTFRLVDSSELRASSCVMLLCGWAAAAINYGLFVAIVLARPGIEPLLALFLSSLVAMVFSYLGMRFAAFREHGGSRHDEPQPSCAFFLAAMRR